MIATYHDRPLRLTLVGLCSRADTVLAILRATSDSSNRLYRKVPSEMRPAFFQLVQHPVQATLTLQEMHVAAGLNNLRASQAALIANTYKSEVERLFREDYSHEIDYHTLLDGMYHSSSFI